MELSELRNRLRIELDDIVPEGVEDYSDALYSNDDLDYYLDLAEQDVIVRTLAMPETLEVHFQAEEDEFPLPRQVVEIRQDTAFLKTTRRVVFHRNEDEDHPPLKDYGVLVPTTPFENRAPGVPRHFTLDFQAGVIKLYPTPIEEDDLVLKVYTRPATPLKERGCTALREPRDIDLMITKARSIAYRKHDADAYDPERADRWEQRAEEQILRRRGEKMRRHRKPGKLGYGGI